MLTYVSNERWLKCTSKFQVMKALQAELKNSGMSEEEILAKTSVLMKAFKRSDPSADIAQYALASKQRNSALKKNNTSPKDFTLVIISIYSIIINSV